MRELHHRAEAGSFARDSGPPQQADEHLERRHRATLWTVYGVPQAINAGDMLFSLSRVALHRLSDLGFSDTKVLRLMRLYDRTCVALCEGQYIDIATSSQDAPMTDRKSVV